MAGLATTEYDPDIGYKYVASARISMPHERGQYLVETNRAGHRSSGDYSYHPPEGRLRLLMIGDSQTAGDGVDNHERFSDRLEEYLPGVQAVNCALPGSGTDQQLLLLQRFSALYEYDALMVCPMVENIRRNVAHFRIAVDRESGELLAVPKPYFTLEGDELRRHHVPVPHPAPPLRSLPADALPFVDFGGSRASTGLRRLINQHAGPLKAWMIKASGFQPHPEYDNPGSSEWRLMAALLRAMAVHAGGRPVVLMPLPYYIHIEHPSTANYLPRFREMAAQLNAERSAASAVGRPAGAVHVVDVLPRLWHLSGVDRFRCRYLRDPHYTPFAHETVAAALAAELPSLGLAAPRSEAPSQSRGVAAGVR